MRENPRLSLSSQVRNTLPGLRRDGTAERKSCSYFLVPILLVTDVVDTKQQMPMFAAGLGGF